MPVRLLTSVDDVHVWSASSRIPREHLIRLAGTLSEDEHDRAQRYVNKSVRDRFVAARGALRTLLGRYLECDPGKVRFRYGVGGRPELASRQSDAGLSFNVSHSHELTLIAMSRKRRMGIDLERIRPIPELEAIARDFFTATERADWGSLPEDEKLRAFFQGWTRKEAILKAIGVGLATSPGGIEVCIAGSEQVHLRHIESGNERLQEWRFLPLPHIAGYVSALAVEATVSPRKQVDAQV
jgi:4'-phosphopantetheinyl transferase